MIRLRSNEGLYFGYGQAHSSCHLDDCLPLFHLKKRSPGPVPFAHSLHVVGIQYHLGVGRICLRDHHRIHWTNCVADGATDATFHIDLMLEIKIRDGVNWTESTATTTINTGLLIDVVVKLGLLHHRVFLYRPAFFDGGKRRAKSRRFEISQSE